MKTFLIKLLLVYLTILSFCAIWLLFSSIVTIVLSLNITAIIALLVDLFIAIVNLFYFFRRASTQDTKTILLYNIIFSLISGLVIRIGGYPFANDLGLNLAIGYVTNAAGPSFLLNFNWFNIFMNFPNTILPNATGFHIEINLIMWGIGIFLLTCYKKINKVAFNKQKLDDV
jgi:hypothetical protein